MPNVYEQKSQRGSSWLVALPKSLFKAKGIKVGDELEFILDNGNIIVKKKEKSS
ncbi:MAG: AbrB/MazE/SpoVT family DNA-binding domain-containing protein [Candidatus Hodarchaeales archaeon]